MRNLGNAVKYISCGEKDAGKLTKELRKAAWDLNGEIEERHRAAAG